MNNKKTEYYDIQRKMVASITTDSWQNIPHISYVYEPDVTELFEEYQRINRGLRPEDKITFNTVILKIITEGIKAAPVLNSHIEYNHKTAKGKITTFENIDISMPTILPDGRMMTTNLHNCQDKTIDRIAADMKELREKMENSNLNEALYTVAFNKTVDTVKKGKILQALLRIAESKLGKTKTKLLKGQAKKDYYSIPESERLCDRDIEQGTITVSNIGSLYRGQRGTAALLEIIPPQVAVFCIGAVQERPVVKEINGKKEIVIGKVLPICMAMDHRAMDFGEAVPCIQKLDEIFDNPSVIRQWLDPDKQTLTTVKARKLSDAS
ncbi:MAG: 2-oxo acid dehydrogenase subunit E2 [Clostridia bacterium]|nr:2-oxo acid dehydrogenase subunit E2 [Clostridia bacterium]